MPRIIHDEFRDEQSPTKYPFVDDATLRTITGFEIHPATFIDASVYPQGGGSNMGIRLVEIGELDVILWIGDDSTQKLARGTIDRQEGSELIKLEDSYRRPAGVMIADPFHTAVFQTWPIGEHELTAKAAPFVANCTIPTPELGLHGFLANAGVVAGDVWLIGEYGVILRADDDETIRVDVVGDPLFRRAICQDRSDFVSPRFLRTINGIGPDAYGNFNFNVGDNDATDSILRVRPMPPNEVIIEAVGKPMNRPS